MKTFIVSLTASEQLEYSLVQFFAKLNTHTLPEDKLHSHFRKKLK